MRDLAIGDACASLVTSLSHCVRKPMVSLECPAAARSAVPMLFRAEPARSTHSGGRPCAIQAGLGLWGHSL